MVSEINSDLPGLDIDRLLKHTKRRRNLWQETSDQVCKKAFNRIYKIITRKRALLLWETKTAEIEISCQALWHIAKSLMNMDSPRAPNVIHGHLDIKFHPLKKANAIDDCLEK